MLEQPQKENFNEDEEKSEKTLSEYLRERFGEKAPRIAIKFFLGPHVNNIDANGIKELIDGTDIYIPEAKGWRPESLSYIKNSSAGAVPKEKIPDDSFYAPIYETLYSSNKPIAIVDIPADLDTELESKRDKFSLEDLALEDDASYDEALEILEKEEKGFAEMIATRENYMISHLGPAISEIFNENPDLLKKREINVLFNLGVAHTGILKKLQEDTGISVSAQLRYSPMSFDYITELFRRYFFHLEVPKIVSEKALLSVIFTEGDTGFKEFLERSNSAIAYKFERFLFDQFSSDEIREIYNTWKKRAQYENTLTAKFNKELRETEEGQKIEKKRISFNPEDQQFYYSEYEKWEKEHGYDKDDFGSYLLKLLQKKNIKIPKTDDDAEEILKNYKNGTPRTIEQ